MGSAVSFPGRQVASWGALNMNRLSLLSGSALVACAVSISVTACAQDAREFNIPAGALGMR
jgi:hypothetical protein